MTKPREKTREELQAEIEDGKKKIRQLENREKVLRQSRQSERGEISLCGDKALGRAHTPARVYKCALSS